MRKGIQLIFKDYIYPDNIGKCPKWLDVSGILFNEEGYDGTFFAIIKQGANENVTNTKTLKRYFDTAWRRK